MGDRGIHELRYHPGRPGRLEHAYVAWVSFNDGQMSGSAGCNDFKGPYSYEDGVVVFDELVDTGFCVADNEGESLMQADRAFSTVVFGSTGFEVDVVGHRMVWTRGDETIELIALDEPPGPFPPFDESVAAEKAEDWWWQLLDGESERVVALSHPAAEFNFTGLRETVASLNGALNVIVDRRVFGTESQPMTCYAVTDGQDATTGAAVTVSATGDG